MGDDRSCNIEGICIVLIKIFNGMVWELKWGMYLNWKKKTYISWYLESIGFRDI